MIKNGFDINFGAGSDAYTQIWKVQVNEAFLERLKPPLVQLANQSGQDTRQVHP